MTKYLDTKRVQGVSLAGHSDPMVIGGTSSGTGSSTWADGTQDGSDHTVWYDIRRGVTVGEDDHQSGNGVTGLANASTNGGDGFTNHPTDTIASQGSTSQWGIRFKLTIDSITTNSSSTVKVGIGMSSSNGDGGGGHEGSLVMKFNNSTRKFMCTGSKSGGDTDDGAKTKEIGSNMMATGTYYCTVWQIGVISYTKIKAQITTNSDYTTSATSSEYCQDNDNWGNEDANFVKYFRVFNSKSGSTSIDNHVYFKVEDMKLWNGTNDFTTTPTTTVDMAHSTGVGSSSTGAKSRYTQYNERSPLVIREEPNWGNNGTKMNHTPAAIVEKAALVTIAGSAKFDGDDDTLAIGSSTTALTPANFTMAFWYKPISVSSPSIQRIYHNGGTGSEKIEIQVYNNKIYATIGSSTAFYTGSVLVNDKAEHWVITCNGTTMTGYRDNVQDGTGSGNDTRLDTASGKAISHTSETLNGYLGDFVLTTDVITATERADLASGAIKGDALDNKVLYYPFTADLNDDSGNNYHGTAGGDTAIDTTIGFPLNSSDLPEGTLFEETDTKKVYFLQSGVWEQSYPRTPTYTGDMSSGWTTASGDANDFVIDTTNDEVDFLNSYNNPPDNVRWDSSTVATLSTTAWVVRFAYQNTGTAANDNPVWWSGFSTHSTVLSNSTDQDFIGFGTQVGNGGTNMYPYLYASDNGRLDQADAAQRLQLNSSNVNLVSNNTKYYIEIVRDGNVFTVNAYSDSDYSTLLCSSSYTFSAIGTIRYFIIANYIQGDNVTGTFSEFKWWNGDSEV